MEEGLLEDTLLIFEAKKSKGDYHQQFDHQVFSTVHIFLLNGDIKLNRD
jgi:hypothetical protein